MKEKTYIIVRRDFTYINFSIFPEMATYFQRKYASPKITTTISEKNCITLSPATVFTTCILVSRNLTLSFNRRSPICSPFNNYNNTLIENYYEVCLILIKRYSDSNSFLKCFPVFRKWINRNYTPTTAMIFQEQTSPKCYRSTQKKWDGKQETECLTWDVVLG